MRHAKAEPFADQDELRALTSAGRQDAAAAGRWLREQGVLLDAAWVSAAVRTRETWEILAAEVEVEVQPRVESAIYAGGTETLLGLLGETEESCDTVLVVGHNPLVAYLTHLLDDGQSDPVAWAAVSEGFPPASMAILSYAGSWAELTTATAQLTSFYVGSHE